MLEVPKIISTYDPLAFKETVAFRAITSKTFGSALPELVLEPCWEWELFQEARVGAAVEPVAVSVCL